MEIPSTKSLESTVPGAESAARSSLVPRGGQSAPAEGPLLLLYLLPAMLPSGLQLPTI